MVQNDHFRLSIRNQCELLFVNLSSYYYSPKGESESNLEIMKIIDQEYMKYPFYGSRQMMRNLNRMGYNISRHRVRRLMRKMGLIAVYQKPRTSICNLKNYRYPYLLSGLNINVPNQVWCSDITYISVKNRQYFC
jgi:putative transposase